MMIPSLPRIALVASIAVCTLALGFAPATASTSDAGSLNVYLNADMTHTTDVGHSLELGLRAGLVEGADRFGGAPIQVLVQDHQNNMRRTEQTIMRASDDPQLLAIVGGMHTPHYLKYGPTINERQIVLMLPWSAGGTLTRLANGPDNYIFRLSVDDTKAAPFLVAQAQKKACERVATIALDNGWGRGNAASIAKHLQSQNIELVHQSFVRRDAGMDTVGDEMAAIRGTSPDCVIMVLSPKTSASAANALLLWDSPPRVLSHWGILGGGYREIVAEEVWTALNIAVLSSCVLETPVTRPTQLETALRAARTIKPSVQSLNDLWSSPAFAHAYDLGLLLSAAAKQAANDPRWSEGNLGKKTAIRDALEALNQSVDGLLKTYDRPYHTASATLQDGHEALHLSDLCLVRMTREGNLEPHNPAEEK